jgi:hypothetical protein
VAFWPACKVCFLSCFFLCSVLALAFIDQIIVSYCIPANKTSIRLLNTGGSVVDNDFV